MRHVSWSGPIGVPANSPKPTLSVRPILRNSTIVVQTDPSRGVAISYVLCGMYTVSHIDDQADRH